MRGKFITFEGCEGSGKSTILRLIVEKLKEEGIRFILSREPGGTKIGEEIRSVILDKANTEMDPVTEALLYAASRRQHVQELIIPTLNKGISVLSDRYVDSSLAYQGGARGLGIELIAKINEPATEGVKPDLTVLFDINPEEGLKRIAQNASREVNRLDLEALDFHKKVRKAFLDIAKSSDHFAIIDASKPIDEVFEAAYKIVHKTLTE